MGIISSVRSEGQSCPLAHPLQPSLSPFSGHFSSHKAGPAKRCPRRPTPTVWIVNAKFDDRAQSAALSGDTASGRRAVTSEMRHKRPLGQLQKLSPVYLEGGRKTAEVQLQGLGSEVLATHAAVYNTFNIEPHRIRRPSPSPVPGRGPSDGGGCNRCVIPAPGSRPLAAWRSYADKTVSRDVIMIWSLKQPPPLRQSRVGAWQ